MPKRPKYPTLIWLSTNNPTTSTFADGASEILTFPYKKIRQQNQTSMTPSYGPLSLSLSLSLSVNIFA